MANSIIPTQREVSFLDSELIVSKTDFAGKITYANRVFMRVSNFSEHELLGKNHNVIRHPDMPAGVFYGLWKTLKSGNEFFGLVKNITAGGDFYWVFANITPDMSDSKIVGFYSVRRQAPKAAIQFIEPIYKKMREIEGTKPKQNDAERSWKYLLNVITESDYCSYDAFALNLYQQHVGK